MAELYNTALQGDANQQLYYRFEDNLTDSSSGGHNGTGEGSPSYVTGKYGKAISLTNAGNSRILTNWTPALGTGQFSVVCWVYATTAYAFAGIASTQNGTSQQGFRLSLEGTKYFQFQCSASSGNADTITGSSVITDGSWYHVAGVRDGTNINLYVNGVSAATPVTSTPRNISGGIALRVGSYWSTSTGDLSEWEGYIDDFAVFNDALTADEVYQLYSEGVKHFQFI